MRGVLQQHQPLVQVVAAVVALLLEEGLRAHWVGPAPAPYNNSLCDRRRPLGYKPVVFEIAI